MSDSAVLATIRMRKIGFAYCEPIAGMYFAQGTPLLGKGFGITEETTLSNMHVAWSSAGLAEAKKILAIYMTAGHKPFAYFLGKHIPNATAAEGAYRGEDGTLIELFTPNIGRGRYCIAFRPTPFDNELDFDPIAQFCQGLDTKFARLSEDVLDELLLSSNPFSEAVALKA